MAHFHQQAAPLYGRLQRYVEDRKPTLTKKLYEETDPVTTRKQKLTDARYEAISNRKRIKNFLDNLAALELKWLEYLGAFSAEDEQLQTEKDRYGTYMNKKVSIQDAAEQMHADLETKVQEIDDLLAENDRQQMATLQTGQVLSQTGAIAGPSVSNHTGAASASTTPTLAAAAAANAPSCLRAPLTQTSSPAVTGSSGVIGTSATALTNTVWALQQNANVSGAQALVNTTAHMQSAGAQFGGVHTQMNSGVNAMQYGGPSLMYTSDGVQTHGNTQLSGQSAQTRMSFQAMKKFMFDDLPVFDGESVNFLAFWDPFYTLVHTADASDFEKFVCLKKKLKGTAANALLGYTVLNSTYEGAVSYLLERFGNVDVLKDELYAQLCNLPVAQNNAHSLRKFMDKFETLSRQLSSLGENIDVGSNRAYLVKSVRDRLPETVLLDLERCKQRNVPWTVQTIKDALSGIAHDLETIERIKKNKVTPQQTQQSSKKGKPQSKSKSQDKNPNDTEYTQVLAANAKVSASQSKRKQSSKSCMFCTGEHSTSRCRKVSTMGARKEFYLQKNMCFACAKTGHVAKTCPKPMKCFKCKEVGHGTCLCPEVIKSLKSSTVASVTTEDFDEQEEEVIGAVITNQDVQMTEDVNSVYVGATCLMTTEVSVYSPKNSDMVVNTVAFFDSGSAVTFVSHELMGQLKAGKGEPAALKYRHFGASQAKKMQIKRHPLVLMQEDGSEYEMLVNAVPRKFLGSTQTKPKLSQADVDVLMKLPGWKSNVTQSKARVQPEILIGNDNFWNIIGTEKVTLPSGMYAVKSMVGWIVAGRDELAANVHSANLQTMAIINLSMCPMVTDDEGNCQTAVFQEPVDTAESLQRLFDLDSSGIQDNSLTEAESDEWARQQFKEKVSIAEDGRLQTGFAWRVPLEQIPDNYDLCFGRHCASSKRLAADPELRKSVHKVLEEQEKAGVIKEVPSEGTNGPISYLPLTFVVTPQKTTTKTRVCLDASAGQVSVNSCQLRGPVGNVAITDLLMRLRREPYAVQADCEKAFLQIKLLENEQGVTRFLYYKDPENPGQIEDNIRIMQMTRIGFGFTNSMSVLMLTIEELMNREGGKWAELVKKCTYVDNIILPAKSQEELTELYQWTKQAFAKYQFNLREYISNCQEFNETIPDADRTTSKVVKTLGVIWDTTDDTLSVRGPKESDDQVFTKQLVLSKLMSVFDPLGMFLPITLKAKLFMQKLTGMKLDWKDPLPENEAQEWSVIQCELQKIPQFKLPRFMALSDPVNEQLHVFCDGSGTAYGAVVYLRQVNQHGEVRCSFVNAKNRLKSSSKPPSTPRTELLSVDAGTKLLETVENALDLQLKPDQRFVWSDSMVSLSWIKSPKKLPTFVQNRCERIRQHDCTFRYINTYENPADHLTRQLSSYQLQDPNHMWWRGPDILYESQEKWTEYEFDPFTTEQLLEMAKPSYGKESTLVTLNVNAVTDSEEQDKFRPVVDCEQYSSFNKVKGIAVYVLRFLKKKVFNKLSNSSLNKLPFFKKHIQKVNECGQKTVEEFEVAQAFLDWQAQREHLKEVRHCLLSNKSHKMVRELNIKMGEDAVMRSHGRLMHAPLEKQEKQLTVLPKNASHTKLLIEHFHLKMMHAGVQTTLAAIRERWWILSGRQQVKNVIWSCNTCKRIDGGPYLIPQSPDLPKERLTPTTVFNRCGCDYFGPLTVKLHNGERTKVYIALYTCFVTRYTHLDYVCDLTAKEFMQSLIRFVSLYGKPELMLTDNATYFGMAEKFIGKYWQTDQLGNELTNYCNHEGIKFRHTVPLAPFQGGLYEIMVKLAKRCLKGAIGKRIIDIETLRTLLPSAAAVMNERPLTYLHSDVDSLSVLRPCDFLNRNRTFAIPHTRATDDEDYVEKEDSADLLRKQLKLVDELLNSFWLLYKQEYCSALRERTKTGIAQKRVKAREDIKVGDVIQINDNPNVKRTQWQIARVIKLHESADGQVRSADVRLPNKKILHRSIGLLYPFETTGDHTEKVQDTVESKQDKKGSQEEKQQQQHIDQQKVAANQVRRSARIANRQTAQPTASVNLIGLGLIVLMCLSPVTATLLQGECTGGSGTWHIMKAEHCRKNGYIVYQQPNNNMCWEVVKCTEGLMLHQSGTCEPEEHCDCPSWASSCVHFGTNKPLDEEMQAALARAEPSFCSLTPDDRCNSKPNDIPIPTIELIDGTQHKVKHLQITVEERLMDEFECFGEKTAVGDTGTPEYCETKTCATVSKRLCWVPREEKAFYNDETGIKIPIKAWGHKMTRVYNAKHVNSEKTVCLDCAIQCIKGGVKVTTAKKTSSIEISSGPVSYTRPFPDDEIEFYFSPEINMHDHLVEVRIWKDGFLINQMSKMCSANPFCEQIKCWLCIERIVNDCTPKQTILFIAIIGLVMMYFGSKVLYTCMKIVSMMIKTISWCCKKCKKTVHARVYIPIQQMDDPEHVVIDIDDQPRAFRRNYRAQMGMTLSIMMMLFVIQIHTLPQAAACSDSQTITAEQISCVTNSEGQQSCKVNAVTQLNMMPVSQQSCLMIKNAANEPLGTLIVETLSLELKCVKRNSFFTRSYAMHVQAAKRCSGAGSCVDTTCEDVQKDTKIEEFKGEANEKPGMSYCAEAVGCWSEGCFLCSAACMLWRAYAIEQSPTVFEVYRCATFEYEAKIKVRLDMQNQTQHQVVKLRPGVPTSFKGVRITLQSATVPQMPIMDSTFISDGARVAITDASASGQPVAGTVGSLQCSTRERAIEFNKCYLAVDTCMCTPRSKTAGCTCTDLTVEDLFNKQNLLPLDSGQVMLLPDIEQSSVRMQLSNAATVNMMIQVSLNGVELYSMLDKNKCILTVNKFSGCHSCVQGMKLEYGCRSDKSLTLGHISCEEIDVRTSVRCSPEGTDGITTIHVNEPLVDDKCSITCSAGKSVFHLKARAEFIHRERLGKVSTPIPHKTILNSTWSAADKLHAIGNGISSLFSVHYVYAIICIICIIALFMLITPVLWSTIYTSVWTSLWSKKFKKEN